MSNESKELDQLTIVEDTDNGALLYLVDKSRETGDTNVAMAKKHVIENWMLPLIPNSSNQEPVENEYPNIFEMISDQGNQTTDFLNYVVDASDDPDIDSGDAFYKKNATSTATLADDYTRLSDNEKEAILAGQGTETADCGSVIPLDTIYGHNCNLQSANTNARFTLDNQNIINSYARVLVNVSQATLDTEGLTEIDITGATQQGGIPFTVATNLILLVWNDGDSGIKYQFQGLEVSSGGQYQNTDNTNGRLRYINIPSDFDFTAIPANYDNAIWNIRYIHDLSGSNVTLPANVTLNFQGGRITNYGTITGDETRVNSTLNQIFDGSGDADGTWKIESIFVEWFGAVGDGTTDDSSAINNAIDFCKDTFSSNLHFQGKIYSIESPIKWKQTVNLIGKSISAGNVGGTTLLCNFDASTISTPPVDIYTGTYAVVLDYTPMLYNGDTGVITQAYLRDIRLDGNDLDVYGLYVNEMYYTTIDRFQVTQCNKSPYTFIKSQFCQFRQLTMVNSSGDFRLLNCTSTTINGLNVENITSLEDSWLKILHDTNKTGITIVGLHYEESAGGTGLTQTDFITIGQRGVTFINPEVTISGTGQERYINLLASGTSYSYDGISIATTNQANNVTLSSDMFDGDIKLKIAADATELSILGDLPNTDVDTWSGTGRERLGTQKFGLDFVLMNPSNGNDYFSFPSVNEMKFGNASWVKSGADNFIDSTAGRVGLRAGGSNPDVVNDGRRHEIHTSAGSPNGTWEDGLLRLSGYYFWVDGSGRLMRSTSTSAPTSDSDGVVVGTQT